MNVVDAVKTPEEIAAISLMLEKHGGEIYRDIWNLGINLALRISDLLSLKRSDFVNDDSITVIEKKTGKSRTIKLNQKAQSIVNRRLSENPDDMYLFQSKSNRAKSINKAIGRVMVARKFAEVGEILGIHLGTHSMRKTRGFAMWSAGVSLEVICKVLNHSSPAVTMVYIGLTQDTVDQTYDDFVL